MKQQFVAPVTVSGYKTWRKQRIAWITVLFAVIILLLGLGERNIQGPEPVISMRASYAYELDKGVFSPLHVWVQAGQNEKYAYIWLEREYLKLVQVEKIVPKPDDISLGKRFMVYRFRIYENKPWQLYSFYIRPKTAGKTDGHIRNHRGEVCVLSQVIQ